NAGSGTVTLTNSTVSGNQAMGGPGDTGTVPHGPGGTGGTGRGGGMFTTTGAAGSMMIDSSTLSGNLASDGSGGSGTGGASAGQSGMRLGGGLFNNGATVQITNSTVTNNSASD